MWWRKSKSSGAEPAVENPLAPLICLEGVSKIFQADADEETHPSPVRPRTIRIHRRETRTGIPAAASRRVGVVVRAGVRAAVSRRVGMVVRAGAPAAVSRRTAMAVRARIRAAVSCRSRVCRAR